jgi:outer membrane protein OmpA-like peptidoglycan-associated protein/tetratricopeptide (TPR) repeat protein
MKKLIAVVALITLVYAAQAQAAQDGDSKDKDRHAILKYPKVKTGKKLKLANQLMKDGSYYNAAEYYEDVLKAKPDNIKVMHALALINQSLRDYKSAEKYYKLEIQKDEKKWPNDKYFLAEMQKMNGKYDEAKKSYQEYLKSDIGKDEKSYKSLAKIGIEGCDSSVSWLANPNKIRVDHEDAINCITTDMSPKVLRGGRILYASLASDTATVITKNEKDYYAKIFTARKQGKDWVEITKLPYPPNDAKNHVANAILSTDENTMYFTKCDQSEIVKMKCKIFRSTKQGAEWSNAEEVKELNSPTNTTTEPAFGQDKDGKPILYFVSDRGGKGGMDIFYAPILEDGKFGPIKNAGNEVNTPGDDMTPFYDFKNKALYFSTDGRPSLGGLDVYRVVGYPDAWGVPSNVGAPVNSQADDIYYALDENGKKGFVVSNRIGTKTTRGETSGDDIWSVAVKEDVVMKGIFALRTDPSRKPVEGVDASMYHVNGANFEFMSNVITTKDPFYFTLKRAQQYKINGNKEGLWPAVENVNVKEDEERDTIDYVFLIDPIIKKKVKIEDIYFAFDKSNVIDFYKEKMDSVISVLMQNPGFSVEVEGHTDSKGSDEYNMKLSQRRADEAASYLVSKGVTKERVITKALGESQPLAPNEKDGKDDPEGRQRNRRVMFKIIPDKPENAPEIEYQTPDPVDATKTGPGYDKK